MAQPNVIVILTDDQGYGDMSCHGHPVVKTPHMDRLHDESVRLDDFHVAPMCAPTRGALMTGVDALRSGCTATCLGRSVPRDGHPMIAEAFRDGGYHTGIFGKWHLGYNRPHLPMDRGFETALYFLGFGLTGMGHHWASDYFDPHVYRNGVLEQASGYCNDIWFDEAMSWIDAQDDGRPFFCYLPTNLPHFPEWVDESYSNAYGDHDARDFYGMIANIDENLGRLDAFLEKRDLKSNTILIFLGDNGSVHTEVYNAGMTGGKCTRTEGGHRVHCFIRWPDGDLISSGPIETPTQVQDLFPTLVDLCDLPSPGADAFDGVSLAGLLRGEAMDDRTLVVQYCQKAIEKWDAAVIRDRWRLLEGRKLYDVRSDLAQAHDVAEDHPDVVGALRDHYERWWREIEPTLDDFQPTHIDPELQRTVTLTSSDWEDVRADAQANARLATCRPVDGDAVSGHWHLLVKKDGDYDVALRRYPREADVALGDTMPAFVPRFGKPEPEGVALSIAQAALTLNGSEQVQDVSVSDHDVHFKVRLDEGRSTLLGRFLDGEGQDVCGAYFCYITPAGDN